ncbi:MAG: BREX-1 system phosphatase PglZ type A, partial [Candidatus Saccharimonadales bacterium]
EALGSVEIVVFNDNPLFVRNYVLHDIPKENVIIYRASEQPDPMVNQLLDIELANASDVFIPDESTLVLNALELTETYRYVVRRNSRFFKNQKRLRDVKKLFPVSDPSDLQMAIYATMFDAEDRRLERVLAAIFMNYRDAREEFVNSLKFVDTESLADILSDYFGLQIADLEKLDALWDSLLISYFRSTLGSDVDFGRYKTYLLPNHGNVRIFTRDLMKLFPSAYIQISTEVANRYGLDKVLSQLEMNDYIDSDAIAGVDDLVISDLIKMLSDKKDISEYLRRREVGFYYRNRRADYQMLAAANAFRIIARKLIAEVKTTDKDTAIQHYADELYKVDTAYRHFNFYYDRTTKTDEYMGLAQEIEYLYGEEWLLKLVEKWEGSVEDENWAATKHPMLSDFYDKYLRPLDDKKDRVFVIISDGLRYEVAKEIASQSKLAATGGDVSTNFALALLPSITPVGMAALLPHETLEFDGTAVTADGMKTDASSRDKVLKVSNKDNLAIRFEDVRAMKKSEWKSYFSGAKYVYIYHDKIDITGHHDDAATFAACDSAIDEISDLIVDLHTTFSGVNVYITADHGFFYQTGSPEARQKMPKIIDAAKQKERYAISKTKDSVAISYRLSDMYPGSKSYVNTPHANVVFARQGGIGRYYHGGALPQEVVVPIVNFKSSRTSIARDKVNITYAGISLKITNSITYLTFRQNEPVSTEKIAARYKAWFEEADGTRISDEVTIIADSAEKDVSSREYREKFVFAARAYEPETEY